MSAPSLRLRFLAPFTVAWLALGSPALAEPQPLPSTNAPVRFMTAPLSMADAITLALRQGPEVRKAAKDVEAATGIAIQTQAIVIPKAGVAGDFGATQPKNVDSPDIPGITFGTDQNWNSQFRVVQSLYEGGRMLSSLRAAKLIKERSLLDYQVVVADSIVETQVAYYNVLLAELQIVVNETAVNLLTNELADTQRRFDAGTVTRYNVLRAEVELANERPKLSRSRNAYRIAKNILANRLAFDIPKDTGDEIPLNLTDKLVAEPYEIALSPSIALAFAQRPELGSLRKTQALRHEDVVRAKAGYLPRLEAYAGYEGRNSMFSTDLAQPVNGWVAGVQLNWNIFDGFLTRGKVMEAQALHDRTTVELDDYTRKVELDVRTAYSNFIEAREVLESTRKVVEQAEETLRLATSRNDAGTGTQLDVLSARSALTEAQTTQNTAVRDYEVARARMARAIGANIPSN